MSCLIFLSCDGDVILPAEPAEPRTHSLAVLTVLTFEKRSSRGLHDINPACQKRDRPDGASQQTCIVRLGNAWCQETPMTAGQTSSSVPSSCSKLLFRCMEVGISQKVQPNQYNSSDSWRAFHAKIMTPNENYALKHLSQNLKTALNKTFKTITTSLQRQKRYTWDLTLHS